MVDFDANPVIILLGTTFTAIDAAARIADFGKDNYAAQFFYGVPGSEPQVSVAWASNWQYVQTTEILPFGCLRQLLTLLPFV
jgi:sucrose-6-phosphate hydrolase SacC (GH32 family)